MKTWTLSRNLSPMKTMLKSSEESASLTDQRWITTFSILAIILKAYASRVAQRKQRIDFKKYFNFILIPSLMLHM